ncbi:MAG: hypothetical protein ACK4YQ_17920 [Phenylobacterium sp.]|uniref:hypothetical protein n=1 Tax=Phenylobacterium sp. TaxID=1871053 RepID=UPI00391CD891
MRLLLRVLVGLAGAAALLLAAQFWLNPLQPAARLGLDAQGALGIATIRADIAAFFGAAGLFALAAAARAEARLMTTPLLLVALALAGRVVTVVDRGFTPEQGPPMVVEAVLVALFALARRGMK